jgi:V/A-type H+-transporting ATPase subunit K
MIFIATLFLGVLMLTTTLVFTRKRRRRTNSGTARKLVIGLGGFNLVLGLILLGLGLVSFLAPPTAHAAELGQETGGDTYATLAAAISAGLGSIGAAYAVGATGSAAIGVIAEKPEAFGRVLIFVGLAEGIAIYGLIIAFMILGR